MLIDKANIHNNRLQVINQYEIGRGEGGAARSNRYDVTVLVNGLPLVHIELKRRGVDIREAFNQIDRYQRDSFWAGSGLFEYVQLFVISNGTLTKYYSNTTRRQHLSESSGGKKARKTSNSFEFTSWWADATNKPIQDLTGFTKTFFAKHALLNILTRYCVLTADRMLLGHAPVPDRRDRADLAEDRDLHELQAAWHARRGWLRLAHDRLGQDADELQVRTTGVQASRRRQGAIRGRPQGSRLPDHARVRPLREGRRQLEHLDRGAQEAAGEPEARKIIITTIQKLSTFIAANKGHEIYDGHIVIIFDECHRSQFGDMHSSITGRSSGTTSLGLLVPRSSRSTPGAAATRT